MRRHYHPELILPAKLDLRALAAVSRFAGTDDSRDYLMGVRVEVGPRDVVYVATDGKRLLAMRQEKLRDEPDNDMTGRFTIPTQHCRAFKLKKDQDSEAELFGDDERLSLRWRDTDVTFTPLHDGDFIGRWVDWRHVIPRYSGLSEAAQFDHAVLASFQKFADEMPGGFHPFVVHNGRDGGALIRFPQIDAIGVAVPVKIDFQRSTPLPNWAVTDDFYAWDRRRSQSDEAGAGEQRQASGDAQDLGDVAEDLVDRLKKRGKDQSTSGATAAAPASAAAGEGETAGDANGGQQPSTAAADAGNADAGDDLAAAAQRDALSGADPLTQEERDALGPEQRENVDRLDGLRALKPEETEPLAGVGEEANAASEAVPSDGPKKRRGRRTAEQRTAENAQAAEAGRHV